MKYIFNCSVFCNNKPNNDLNKKRNDLHKRLSLNDKKEKKFKKINELLLLVIRKRLTN